MELIQELRSTHALQEAGQLEKKNKRQAVLSLQRQRRLDTNKVVKSRQGFHRYEHKIYKIKKKTVKKSPFKIRLEVWIVPIANNKMTGLT